MKTVTVRFKKNILDNLDEKINEHNFNSRTEFIREAVREKLSDLTKEELLREFLKYRGKSKTKTNYKDNRKTRGLISKKLMKELEEKFI
jgi:metal-responsive CopG/Arc/MetJ family transcriptional regulator